MSEKFDWTKFEPSLGYKVVQEGRGGKTQKLSLALDFSAEEKNDPFYGVQFETPTWADVGDVERRKFFLNALAQFMNAGGTIEEAMSMVFDISAKDPPKLSFPGYVLVDMYLDTEGHATYLFEETGTGKYVRWVQDEYIDFLTLEDLEREMAEEDGEEPEEGRKPEAGEYEDD